MAKLTKAAVRTLEEATLRDYLTFEGEGEDTRTLADLRKEFYHRHIYGLMKRFRVEQAEREMLVLDITDLE